MEYGVPALAVKDGRAVVSSRDVAQVFGKEHKHVLADLDGLLAGVQAHGQHLGHVMFQEVSSTHPTVPGRTMRAFEMDRDGFTLLAMGYTGPKALLGYGRSPRFREPFGSTG